MLDDLLQHALEGLQVKAQLDTGTLPRKAPRQAAMKVQSSMALMNMCMSCCVVVLILHPGVLWDGQRQISVVSQLSVTTALGSLATGLLVSCYCSKLSPHRRPCVVIVVVVAMQYVPVLRYP